MNNGKLCTRDKCKECKGFVSAWTCSCGGKFEEHVTVIQTYEERKNKGKSVNDMVRLNEQINVHMNEGSLYKANINANNNVNRSINLNNNVKQDP